MPLLWALIAMLGGIEIAIQLGDFGLPGISRRWAYTYGAFWPSLISGDLRPAFDLQPWTMYLTHAFLHGGALHVVMNGVILLSIGKLVVQIAGQGRMLLLFVLGAIAGGAGFAALGPDGNIPMVGASSAGFAFIAAWKRWGWMALRATGRSVRPVAQFMLALAALNALLHFALGGTLAWEAHLGGALLGWFIAPLLIRRRA